MIFRYNYHKIEEDYNVLLNKDVTIYCRSVTALQAYRKFSNLNINVIGFTDSYTNKEGEKFAGLPLYTLDS